MFYFPLFAVFFSALYCVGVIPYSCLNARLKLCTESNRKSSGNIGKGHNLLFSISPSAASVFFLFDIRRKRNFHIGFESVRNIIFGKPQCGRYFSDRFYIIDIAVNIARDFIYRNTAESAFFLIFALSLPPFIKSR